MHDGAGRVHVSLFNDGYIAQFDLSAGGGDCLVADVVDGGISTVGHNAQLLFACTDFTRIDNLVLRLQQACQLFGVDAHPRQFVYGDKDIDYFRLCAEQGYFHNPFGSDNLRLDTLRPVAHFFVREAVVADQSVINAEYIAEVVRYGSWGCMLRTFRRSSSHFCGIDAAESDGCSSNVILESPYMDSDLILYTPLMLCISREMGSVMSRSTSAGSAPG